MNDKCFVRVDAVRFQKHIATLTSSQKVFVDVLLDWIRWPRNTLVILSGGPGTGKTHTVTKTLDCVDCGQLRMAPTAHVAQKINGRTIHSALTLDWKPGSILHDLEMELKDEKDVYECIKKSLSFENAVKYPGYCPIVVIDEICMVPGWMSYRIIDIMFSLSRKPVLFIVMGDSHQLRPVKSNNNLFGISFENANYEVHRISLTESKRFTPDYELVIERLRDYVDENDETGLFCFICETYPIVEDIHREILQECDRVLTFTNNTANKYNEFYLKRMPGKVITRLVQLDYIEKENDPKKYIELKPNCLIFVTQNGCSEASNGTLLKFHQYVKEKDVIQCKTLEDDLIIEVKRNHERKFPIVLGYASTIHKFQGETIDDKQVAINFEGNHDLNLIYTALSRVKSIDQIRAVCIGE